ncbi:L-histidine N(alpha)-methyltransferase [uncultured Acetobacteroides sp.]|uniref:L-histidine N(alpha)-methyltransferase n=1 Tax=uncultured Acetobacteroides sp. TaxID=1760811 RepID=UPI0029F57EB2|nr:L-histidine N(alpha)-methyltransferase [uncultured Acetobacteroides sp.]
MYDFEGQLGNNKLVPQILDKSTNETIKEILEGLRRTPKHLDICHFYSSSDFTSSSSTKAAFLNNRILRRSKLIKSNKETIQNIFSDKEKIRLVEVGNDSSSQKTKSIIEILWESNIQFEFIPISNSKRYLEYYITELWQQFPSINVFPLAGNYLDILADLASESTPILVVLSDLVTKEGREEKKQRIEQVSSTLNYGDWVQIDFELKADPRILSKSTPDNAPKKALISTLNEMLQGNFDEASFIYYPHYNPQTGEQQTCLVSTKRQNVYLAIADETISFKMWECISIESVQRYAPKEIESLAHSTGFIPRITLFDYSRQTCCSFWQKE